MDFNALERRARELADGSRWKDALRIDLFMADGDPSLDAGTLGEKIAGCCEAPGDPCSARCWHGRAVEENPEVRTESIAARGRLPGHGVEELAPEAFADKRPGVPAARGAPAPDL